MGKNKDCKLVFWCSNYEGLWRTKKEWFGEYWKTKILMDLLTSVLMNLGNKKSKRKSNWRGSE